MEIDEKFIQITGKAPVGEELKLDQDVSVSLEGQVVKVEEGSNQDGTKNLTYKIKIIECKEVK